jgi:gas vesicle protein
MATKKQSKVVEQPNHSFLTGLSVGLFAGAIGFYLFQTKRGSALRETLQDEWKRARKELYDQGVIDNPEMPFKELVSGYLNELAAWFEEGAERLESTGKKRSTTQKSDKFSGV